ncbi:hypothetical protein CcCBS67573_g05852 [Chytriomyces confervae]|uniref:Dynamin stalk domain-containing protein n=1 Tax=Chytriomyces confervae TaxID=246404 RepID=A0A507FB32_9FUNG|nr:hypothetical protein CcCBS67573_g05852 [Chytriomyces confervae]
MENLFESNCFKTQRNLIDRLRSIGLDKYIELPQIAVMGDTSSGKSSVLSAISGIEFPSSDTTHNTLPNYKLLCSLMREYVQKWDAPMKSLLASYAHMCQDAFHRILRHCGDEIFSRPNEHSDMVLDQCLETVRTETNRVIAESLHVEYRPVTMNPALHENLMKLRNDPLKRALEGLTAKGC